MGSGRMDVFKQRTVREVGVTLTAGGPVLLLNALQL